ncbi:phosphoglycerate mutase family protein [Algoriphagus sp.]|uniref:SixA phosphatase family protein n=1 Tax=Algoriphagus sp. TaxID=1872435 RepID=UPI003289B08F
MKYTLLFLLVLFIAACGSKPEPKTIYIVRHAEKQLTGNDPELSVAGTARSKKLAQILADKKITHIFSTDYKRTRLTAGPTASQAGIEIESYDPRDQEELAKKLRTIEGNVLVVGHSNTVSQLVNILLDKGDIYKDFSDDEYNKLYVVELISNEIKISEKLYKDF